MEKGLKFTFPLACILFISSGHLHENCTVRIDSVAPLLCTKNVSFLEHKKGSGLHTLGNKPSSGLKLSLLITDQTMASSAVAKTQMLFLREAKPMWRGMSKVAGAEGALGKARGRTSGADHKDDGSSSSWVPHPRTGIYFPKGHDYVMDDVPDGAACFGQTYWLRTVDGVDKPDPDVSTQY